MHLLLGPCGTACQSHYFILTKEDKEIESWNIPPGRSVEENGNGSWTDKAKTSSKQVRAQKVKTKTSTCASLNLQRSRSNSWCTRISYKERHLLLETEEVCNHRKETELSIQCYPVQELRSLKITRSVLFLTKDNVIDLLEKWKIWRV